MTADNSVVIAVSRHIVLVLWVLASLAGRASAATAPADFAHFWRQAFLQLQGRPASPVWRSDTLVFAGPGLTTCRVRCHLEPASDLPPVLYLVNRAAAEGFAPGSTHSWCVLDIGALWAEADLGPDPTHHPMYRAVLTAQRALALLLARTGQEHVRAGLVGEGRGGTVALAVAALIPDDAAFVAAHEPVPAPREADSVNGTAASLELREAAAKCGAFAADLTAQLPYFDLAHFVGDIRCPALLSYGGKDGVVSRDEVLALYDALTCDKELAEFPRARHCQAADLQEWSATWRAWANERVQG